MKNEVHVRIELGRLFGVFKSSMEERINHFLDQQLPR